MPRAKPAAPSGRRAEQELQPALDLRSDDEPLLPPLNLLVKPPEGRTAAVDEEALSKNARMLEAVLEDYGVRGQIVQVRPGPVVTLYELEPAPGIKASRVIGLADDIARSMSAISVRVAVVPGRTVIGIELPNLKAETVYLRELLDVPAYENHGGRLVLGLGKDISRRAGHRRPGAHAASVDRRHHRLRQIGRHQHDDPVDPLPDAAGALQIHHGRPEDAGIVGL